MKGYYERVTDRNWMRGARLHFCDHPIYSRCTLFVDDDLPMHGLAVIQQRFNEEEKVTWWGPIDPWLTGDISRHPGFREFFIKYARTPEEGIYPTIELRKLMHALGMKPLKKWYWEVSLDSQKLHLL